MENSLGDITIEAKLASHLHELATRVPPLTNINVIVYKNDADGSLYEPSFLFGHKRDEPGFWIAAGSRLKAQESPQECVMRIIQKELPGITVTIKRLITATHDLDDIRSRNINLYYLCEYTSGKMAGGDTFNRTQRFTLTELYVLPNLYSQDRLILDDLKQTMSLVNSNQDELLVQVDEDDVEIGTIAKKVAHSSNQIHHRAAHIFVFTHTGKVVLQLRSRHKSSSPLCRDMHGGHQVRGQTIDQCAQAELIEELGINCPLTFHHKEHRFKAKQSEFAYCYTAIHDGPFGFDRNEVEDVAEFDCQKLLDGGYDDTYKILHHVKSYLETLRDVRVPLQK